MIPATIAPPAQTAQVYVPPTGRLSFTQIEQLWINEGGDPAWAGTMALIALLESGGNTTSLNNNPSTGDYSVGLWQINYFGDLLGERTQKYGSPAALQGDPAAQARAAIDLLGNNGAGIGNWTTNRVAGAAPGAPLSAGQIAAVMQRTGVGNPADAAAALTTAVGSGIVGGVINAVTAPEQLASDLVSIIGRVDTAAWWARLGTGILGVGLVVAGIVLLISTSGTGRKIAGDATKIGAAGAVL